MNWVIGMFICYVDPRIKCGHFHPYPQKALPCLLMHFQKVHMRAKEFIRYVKEAPTDAEKMNRLATLNESLVKHVETAAEKRKCTSHAAFAALLKEADEIKEEYLKEFHLPVTSKFSHEYTDALH